MWLGRVVAEDKSEKLILIPLCFKSLGEYIGQCISTRIAGAPIL